MPEIILTDINNNKMIFNHPLKVSITRSYDAPADAAITELLAKGSFKEIAALEIMDGTESLFYGIVDEQTERESGSSRKVVLKARSLEALLLDNEAQPQTYCLPSFGILFERHFRELGFTGFEADDKIYNGELVISKGMSQWDVLSDFCKRFSGTVPVITREGIIDIKNRKDQRQIIVGKDRIADLVKKYRRCEMISEIRVRSCSSGGYDMLISGEKAKSIGVKRRRYVNISGSRTSNVDDIRKLKDRTEKAYETIELTYSGLINADKDDRLSVEGCKNDYIIKEISILKDSKGTRTKIFAEVYSKNVDKQEYYLTKQQTGS